VEPRRLREKLEGTEGISSLLLTGDGLHLVVDNATRRIPEYEARLRRANIPFDAIQQVAPSIEDLFVDAVGAGAAPHD
jgi:ABC-2 type transport system ATP-binding protein